MAPEVGIAPTSPPLQGGANLPQLLGEMARQAAAWRAKAGRPARSCSVPTCREYQPGALLLSYGTVVRWRAEITFTTFSHSFGVIE